MLSVILYGRNDNYGYNLHKRAALSINCISELLTNGDDELIFVDYNTPDDLPTFPEAIQDTLTEHARRKLRILRVRPSVHERFRTATHLVALEPIARNVALRRSNPKNRWVLSTNTDMIFIPRRKEALSKVLGSLPAALYHLPRFEIPETLWETFNRLNPREVIHTVKAWGTAARLNEIVYGSDDILYDGPGDFQLAPRDTYFELNAFDERMLLGWHVDSNIAKRLALKLGPPRSFVAYMFGYHCDHTRMATPAHRRDRIENDPERFVANVRQPYIPEQADTWGCANDAIEEISLRTGDTTYSKILKNHIRPLKSAIIEAHYRKNSYDNLWYDIGHVIPFALDLFYSAPRHWNIGWVGCRPATLARFADAWRDLGFTGKILVSQDCASLKDVGNPTAGKVEQCSDDYMQLNADAFVFEAGLVRHDAEPHETGRLSAELTDQDLLRFQLVRRGFIKFATNERDRLRDRANQPRRFIFINAIHNRFEELVTKHVGVTFTPYSSRIRHGFVYADSIDTVSANKFKSTLSNSELRRLIDFVDRAMDAPTQTGPHWARVAAAAVPLLQTISRAGACEIFSRSRDELCNVSEIISKTRLSETLTPSAPFEIAETLPAPERRGLTRAAEYHDWETPEWYVYIEMLLDSPRALAWNARSSWLWTRAQIIFGLSRLGLLDTSRNALVAAVGSDRLIAALSEMLGQIEILPLTTDSPGFAVADWTDKWHADPTRVHILDWGQSFSDVSDSGFDTVVMPHSSIYLHGSSGFVQFLASAAKALRDNGVLVFEADIVLSDRERVGGSGWFAPVNSSFWSAVQEFCGLELIDAFDGALSRATVDRVWESDRPTPGANYFISRSSRGEHLISSVWFLRKVAKRAPSPSELSKLRRLGMESDDTIRPTATQVATYPALKLTEKELQLLAMLTARAAEPGCDADDLREAAFFAEPIFRLLGDNSFCAQTGLDVSALASVQERMASVRTSTTLATNSNFDLVDTPPPANERSLSRCVEYFDWDLSEWHKWVGEFTDNLRPANIFDRASWIWERAQFMYGLARLRMLENGACGLAAMVLPDRVLGAIANQVDRVDVLAMAPSHQQQDGQYWAEGWLLDPRQARVLESSDLGQLPAACYDFVVFPHASICLHGEEGFLGYLEATGRILRAGGILAFAADVFLSLAETVSEDPRWSPPTDPAFWSQVERELGLALIDDFDLRLSRATVDRGWEPDQPSPGVTNFLENSDGCYFVRGTWFLRKTDKQ